MGAAVASGPSRFGYTVRLPLAELTPGDYVLTLEARVGGRTAKRQVPFGVDGSGGVQ